ncbi:glucose-1-phosphate cytidylyltransferase [Lachnospiraceae bacterium 48-33]
MKVIILAGGLGTRISEESHLRPKPMIEIGEKPILWHIMKLYSYYGYNEFIICAGYKQNFIKQYFADYYLYNSDITFDFRTGNNDMVVHNNVSEPWKVTIVDTGLNTMTGGRIKRVRDYIGNETFLMTYGDGVSDVNIDKLVEFHQKQGSLCTLTAVQPEGRFGILDLNENKIISFREKNKADMGWINTGFMVIEPKVFDYIKEDATVFEREPLERLADEGEINCYKHYGFWQCMDTMRDKEKLEMLWQKNMAPWKIW